jgi:hypothetical protein
MKYRQLEERELDALRKWAAEYGRTWKEALRCAWMGCRYNGLPMVDKEGPTLRMLRNELGGDWLAKFKLPAA